MAFDLQVFNKQTQTALTEMVDQDIQKFNEASAGTIVLQNVPTEGDFDIRSSFKAISGLVRRRNAYGSGSVDSMLITFRNITTNRIALLNKIRCVIRT